VIGNKLISSKTVEKLLNLSTSVVATNYPLVGLSCVPKPTRSMKMLIILVR